MTTSIFKLNYKFEDSKKENFCFVAINLSGKYKFEENIQVSIKRAIETLELNNRKIEYFEPNFNTFYSLIL